MISFTQFLVIDIDRLQLTERKKNEQIVPSFSLLASFPLTQQNGVKW